MLTPTLRSITRLLVALYTILGIILFLAPGWAAANFAWRISPFVAMTIGGWCLGNAFIAWKISKVWRWSAVYTTLVYLWTFGILEILILVIFKDKLLLNTPLAWAYTITLVTNVIYAIWGIYTWYHEKPSIKPEGLKVAKWVHISIIGVIIFVGILVIGALFSPPVNATTEGKFLPEKLSLFTLRAFGAFYLSLVMAGITLLRNRSFAPIEIFGQGGMALTVPITIAAFIYFRPEDLANSPGGVFYILAYVVIFFAAGSLLLYYRRQKSLK